MSDSEQSREEQRTGRLREAQERALFWAWTANGEYVEAIEYENRSRAPYDSAAPRQGDRMAQERRLADFHGVRSTEALKLAEMWSHVAQALATGELPVTNLVNVPDPARPRDYADSVPGGRSHP
ncbi:hypothetical protein [Streptomyces sp. NBC_00986]|uniref:hypothetical protein n=1 Tax=Streptomyces sp. NBC_00986 TaxID=2903702 RepID=UPI00386E8D7F|nr:hypothetical protein OG504_45185 [Streptomyces sp. NBC_00986]